MKYVDWVERVMKTLVEMSRETPSQAFSVGIFVPSLVERLGLSPSDDHLLAVHDALGDLDRMRLVERSTHYAIATQEGRKFPNASLSSAWGPIFDVFLEDGQLSFLRALCVLGVREHDDFAQVDKVEGSEIYEYMGLDWNDQRQGEGWDHVRALVGAGMAIDRRTMGSLAAKPTYIGVVRATEERAHAWRERLAAAVADGESTNVDFKRELNVGNNAEKAEFVRDVLALANTKSPGARYLIIGLDDAGAFYASPPIDLTRDRLQQVLNGWCSSPPELQFARVPWQQGEVAIIEVVREPMKLAYTATKSSGKLKAGIVYVRHGPHTEPASDAEAGSLAVEGERARGLITW